MEGPKFRFLWEWVGVSFCIFVVFHLLPSIVIHLFETSENMFHENTDLLVWIFVGLSVVAGYLGYAARGAILETALAATCYLILLTRVLPGNFRLLGDRYVLAPMIVLMVAFIVVSVSAYVGTVIYQRKHKLEPPNPLV